jgi:hypothetical protein
MSHFAPIIEGRTEGNYMSQPRVPKGTPKAGGQYAENRRPDGGELETTVAWARKWSKTYARKYVGADADDIMQEALLTFSSVVKNPDRVVNEASINSACKFAAIAAMKGRSNHRDDGALREYHDTCASEMNRLGRLLTPIEEDAIAADIREKTTKYPPSHGFHRRVMETSFTTTGDATEYNHNGGNDHVLRRVEAVGANEVIEVNLDEFDEDSVASFTMKTVEKDTIAARQMAWDAVAGPAPRPLGATIPKRQATTLRTDVKERGGAVKCAEMFQRGLLDSESLFAPFGTLSEDEKDLVCEVITRHPNYGDNLWAVSMSIAERR